MPSSNRGHYLALGGCLAFLLLAIPALGQEAVEPQDRPAQSQESGNPDQSEGAAESAQDAPPAAASPAAEQPSNSNSDARQRAEEGQGSIYPAFQWDGFVTTSDTLAQWAMAVFGIAATVFSGIAVYLLKRTLEATRDAADYARQAVTHGESAAQASWQAVSEAQNSTTAARRAARITQEMGERQLRAYVNVTGARVIWGNARSISVDVKIKNGGQTPAYRVVHRVHMAAQEQSEEMLPPTRPIAKYDIGPGVEDSLGSVPIQADEGVWDDIRNRRRPLYVWGEIRYDDIFGKEQRITRYRMVLGPMDDLLLPCPEGNEST